MIHYLPLVLAGLLQPHAPLDYLSAASEQGAFGFLGASTCGCAAPCSAAASCGDCDCAACAEPVAPAPSRQFKVIHSLRVLLPSVGVGWKGEIDQRLEKVSELLQAGQSGPEPAAGCCVQIVADSFAAVAPSETSDPSGNPLFTPDILTGTKQLERIHAELAGRSMTAYVTRSAVGPAKLGVLLGQADAATGTMVIHQQASGATWAHELGHLQALGHYEEPEKSGRLMYRYGEVAELATETSCRDCDYLRASVAGRRTYVTLRVHESCWVGSGPTSSDQVAASDAEARDEQPLPAEQPVAAVASCGVDVGPIGQPPSDSWVGLVFIGLLGLVRRAVLTFQQPCAGVVPRLSGSESLAVAGQPNRRRRCRLKSFPTKSAADVRTRRKLNTRSSPRVHDGRPRSC